jgi:drug/metabolite transporter (DMT)-like permease
MSTTAYAIPLALLTTSAFNTGLIVEKRALGKMPPLRLSRAGRTVVSLVSSPAWLAGLALMLTGLACQVIVLTFEPISVVQPVLAAGVALTLVLSRLVLRERLGGKESWCVGIMVVSLVLLALSQDAGAGKSARDASALPLLAVVVPSVAAGMVIAAWPWRHGGGSQRAARTALCAGTGTGLLYGVSALATKGLSVALSGGHAPAGLVTSIAASPYLYLLGVCSAAAMLLYQAALQACRASVLIPVSNVVSSGYFLIAGTWLFHEQLPASPVKLALRLAGIASAALVVVILSRQAARPRQVAGDTGSGMVAGDTGPGNRPGQSGVLRAD